MPRRGNEDHTGRQLRLHQGVRATVENDKVKTFRVNAKVSFVLERGTAAS